MIILMTVYTGIKFLAVIGVALAIFLLWERYFQPAFQPCTINSVINCNAIISGKVSNTLGIPTPVIGLIGYLFILGGAFWKKPQLIFGMATFGLLFCLYIAFREIFQLHVVCPVCLLCQLDMIVVWALSLMLLRKKGRG